MWKAQRASFKDFCSCFAFAAKCIYWKSLTAVHRQFQRRCGLNPRTRPSIMLSTSSLKRRKFRTPNYHWRSCGLRATCVRAQLKKINYTCSKGMHHSSDDSLKNCPQASTIEVLKFHILQQVRPDSSTKHATVHDNIIEKISVSGDLLSNIMFGNTATFNLSGTVNHQNWHM